VEEAMTDREVSWPIHAHGCAIGDGAAAAILVSKTFANSRPSSARRSQVGLRVIAVAVSARQ